MIGMITGVAAGIIILLGLGFLLWRRLQNKHEIKMGDVTNRNSQLRLIEAGVIPGRFAGRQIGNGSTNRLAIGNGPYAGGSGGRVYDVSLSLIPYYKLEEV
jgi:hypothetical protein